MATRRSLGRGLGALLPGADSAETSSAKPAASAAPTELAHELPIESIVPNPDQPRRDFDETELARLAESIGRHGVLQPVVVRPAGEGRYELVVGERRWRASRRAGRSTLPAVVLDVDPRERLELALVENVQRHDLNPIELALAFQALLEGGRTQAQVGEAVGLDRSSVANHVRLLELPRSLQEDVESGRLSVGHAKALLQIPNAERRLHMRDLIVKEGLSVRDTEQRARRLSATPPRRRRARPAPALDADTRALLEQLGRRLQTKLRLEGSPQRGRLEIDYYSAEDLTRIARVILEGA